MLVLSGLSLDEQDPYRRFATELGLLFQIVDDILDVTGSDEELGKPSGSDERHGKVTYVSLFGLERARELAVGSTRRRWQPCARRAGTRPRSCRSAISSSPASPKWEHSGP
ncbi:MAG: polyprenyl synthetase family protein [Solirubrobacterales bacterium]